jgi:aconitase A
MESPQAQAYLASPAVVASSAVNGYISGPSTLNPSTLPPAVAPAFSISEPQSGSSSAAGSETAVEPLLEGFPSSFLGPLLFAHQDNLNTDDICPGKYTYQDDITLERQAEVVMENTTRVSHRSSPHCPLPPALPPPPPPPLKSTRNLASSSCPGITSVLGFPANK